MTAEDAETPTVITAVVHAPDAVRFVVAGQCADQVAALEP
jgi:hypothetical protein